MTTNKIWQLWWWIPSTGWLPTAGLPSTGRLSSATGTKCYSYGGNRLRHPIRLGIADLKTRCNTANSLRPSMWTGSKRKEATDAWAPGRSLHTLHEPKMAIEVIATQNPIAIDIMHDFHPISMRATTRSHTEAQANTPPVSPPSAAAAWRKKAANAAPNAASAPKTVAERLRILFSRTVPSAGRAELCQEESNVKTRCEKQKRSGLLGSAKYIRDARLKRGGRLAIIIVFSELSI